MRGHSRTRRELVPAHAGSSGVTHPQTGERVVLVHGLWMTGAVCALLARRLRACGFQPLLFSYPSIRTTLADTPVHFVGHSLGGLVVLELLAREPELAVGRAVLLGSPGTSSLATQQLIGSRVGRMLAGRALPQWRAERGASVTARVEVRSPVPSGSG
jgi:pimeloyl-ACP methyl ester carboxylesterase